jgi:hypothetical protein
MKELKNKGHHIKRYPLFDLNIGEVDIFSGILTLNYNLEEFNNLLSSENKDDIDYKKFIDTLQHESYHFIQLFSTGYLFNISMRLFEKSIEIKSYVEGLSKELEINEMVCELEKYNFTDIFNQLDDEIDLEITNERGNSIPVNFSVRDIIESMVIFSSFRSNYLNASNEVFIEWSKNNGHYKLLSPYIYAEFFFGDILYEFFSEVCYWALNTKWPVNNFCKILKGIGYSGILEERALNREDFIHIMKKEHINFFHPIYLYLEYEDKGIRHPYLSYYVYLMQQAAEKDTEKAYAAIAKPYESDSTDIKNFIPKIVRLKGGKIRGYLPNKKATKKEEESLRDLTDIMSLMQSFYGALLIFTNTIDFPHLQCHHLECPYHFENVCFRYHRIPVKWQECEFPGFLNDMLKVKRLF